MFREFHILLDSPPDTIFTYEDTVSGKVVLESPRDEAVGWIHVFFHGWVNTEVIQNNNPQTGGPSQSKYIDKEVLFQYYQNVYRGQENLPKKTRHEWPFQFAIEPESGDGSSLPSSGKYHKSSVEYKVIAVLGRIGQSDEHIMSMMNPDDPLFLKNAPLNPTDVFLWAGKHVGGTAEEKLAFIQIRPTRIIDPSPSSPLSWKHEISSSRVPEIQQNLAAPLGKHGLFHSQHQEHIPFVVNLQVARNIVEGSPFPVLLSISSLTIVWNHNPPPVTLVAFKMHLLAKTIERAGHEASEQSHKQLIFERKDLQIPLGQAEVDIAQFIPLILAGNDIIPSFNTRLLQRKYDLSAEVTIEVGGKTFHTPFLLENSITILSQLAASGRPRAPLPALMQKPAPLREEPTTLKLKYDHIGRLTQDGSGPLRVDSVIEAAVTLSKLLTIAAVQHSFPGGSLVKLHAYKPDSRHVNNTNWDQVTDREKLIQMLTHTDQFRVLPSQDAIGLKLGFSDALHGENISLDFPLPSLPTGEKFQDNYAKETRGPTDAVKLDPVSLFNYRLWCAATREKFGEAEIGDFALLQRAFSHELHSHKKHIDVHMAMLAVERCPSLRSTLKSIGVDIGPDEELSLMQKGQPEPQGYGHRVHDNEQGLVQGLKRNFFHRHHPGGWR